MTVSHADALRRRHLRRTAAAVMLLAGLCAGGTGARAAMAAGAVERAPIVAAAAEGVGTLAAGDGGFPPTLWQGSSWPAIQLLIARLPLGGESPTARSLLRRIALTSALPPEGVEPNGAWLAARVALLRRIGDVDGVRGLVAAVPRDALTPALTFAAIDAAWLDGDSKDACAQVDQLRGQDTSPAWQRAAVLCSGLAGNAAEASVGLSVLAEDGNADVALAALVERIGDPGRPLPAAWPPLTPVLIAAANAAKVPLPTAAADAADGAVLAAVAASPATPLAVRHAAVERAFELGSVPTDTVRALAAEVAPGADPSLAASQPTAAVRRARLLAAVMAATDPPALWPALDAYFADADRQRHPLAAARLVAADTHRLVPEAMPSAGLPALIRTLLLQDRPETAAPWIQVLRSRAAADPDAATALDELAPLLAVAGLDAGSAGTTPYPGWWKAIGPAGSGREAAMRLFPLLDALGRPVPDDLWLRLLEGPERIAATLPSPAVAALRQRAVAGRRLGETVLLALASLAGGEPWTTDAGVVGDGLAALRQTDLEVDARRLAVEAMARP